MLAAMNKLRATLLLHGGRATKASRGDGRLLEKKELTPELIRDHGLAIERTGVDGIERLLVTMDGDQEFLEVAWSTDSTPQAAAQMYSELLKCVGIRRAQI